MSSQSTHSRRRVPTQRSAKAFPAATGRRADYAHPLRREHGVERARELPVAVAHQHGGAGAGDLQVPAHVARLLGDPGGGRVGRAAGDEHPPGPHVQEEQHVEDLQADGLDREEVTRQQSLGVGSEEGWPGEACPTRGRRHSTLPQHGLDRRRR